MAGECEHPTLPPSRCKESVGFPRGNHPAATTILRPTDAKTRHYYGSANQYVTQGDDDEMGLDFSLMPMKRCLRLLILSSGLQRMFLRLQRDLYRRRFSGLSGREQAFSLWVDYQNGAITSLQLRHQRFDSWEERLNVPPGNSTHAFTNAMAEICAPLPGARGLAAPQRAAGQGQEWASLTNGFTSLQHLRLESDRFTRSTLDLLII